MTANREQSALRAPVESVRLSKKTRAKSESEKQKRGMVVEAMIYDRDDDEEDDEDEWDAFFAW